MTRDMTREEFLRIPPASFLIMFNALLVFAAPLTVACTFPTTVDISELLCDKASMEQNSTQVLKGLGMCIVQLLIGAASALVNITPRFVEAGALVITANIFFLRASLSIITCAESLIVTTLTMWAWNTCLRTSLHQPSRTCVLAGIGDFFAAAMCLRIEADCESDPDPEAVTKDLKRTVMMERGDKEAGCEISEADAKYEV
ncbi:hypothetical protein B0H12DRAFT_1233314 [Mycena haematopus]|nr:hypothetical protein B0H12DRAFT_1233314 [Mycena haematopus]